MAQQFMQKKCIQLILVQLGKILFKFALYGDNSYLFVNGKEMIKSKAKDSEIVSYLLCLGNISKEFPNTNMEKTGLYDSFYYFSIDHKAIAVNNILDIHNYLIKMYVI